MISTQKIQERVRTLFTNLPDKYRAKLLQLIADPQNIQSLGLWASAIIASFVSVGYAWIFKFIASSFVRFINSSWSNWVFLLAPVGFLAANWVVQRFSVEASGSGVPQVLAANETDYRGPGRIMVDRLLSLKTGAVIVASSLLGVLGGGAVGREGPTIQLCSAIFHFFGKQVRRVLPETSEQTWVVAGAAAGLASAFNTPLGGIVYAIEELGVPHFHRIRTALLSAVIVAGLVSQWLLGSYLFFGYPVLQPMAFTFLPVVILCGFVSGFAGSLWGHALAALFRVRSKLKKNQVILWTIGCGLVMAIILKFDHRASGTGTRLITGFLFNHDHSSLRLVAARIFGTTATSLSGAAAGLFSPSISIGAVIGGWLCVAFHTQHPNLMVLLGMIGFLTGFSRTPFTSFILVLEMTDRYSAIFPMMLVALVANWSARIVDSECFYDFAKKRWMVGQTPPAPIPPNPLESATTA